MKTDSTTELVEMMFQVSRLMKDEMSYACDLIHLSILQIQTLIYINKNQTVSMSDIADYFHTELPSATSLINKLFDQKLVQRHSDEKDRRLVKIVLTDKGKILLKEAVRHRRLKIEGILSYLSEKEQLNLLAILKTLHNKFQK